MFNEESNCRLEELQQAVIRRVTGFVATDFELYDYSEVLQGLNLAVRIEHLIEQKGTDCERTTPKVVEYEVTPKPLRARLETLEHIVIGRRK